MIHVNLTQVSCTRVPLELWGHTHVDVICIPGARAHEEHAHSSLPHHDKEETGQIRQYHLACYYDSRPTYDRPKPTRRPPDTMEWLLMLLV